VPGAHPEQPSPRPKLTIEEQGRFQTVELSPAEIYVGRNANGLIHATRVLQPESLATLRPRPDGLWVTPCSNQVRVNGAPLSAPRLLGKYDLLEIAGAILRSGPPAPRVPNAPHTPRTPGPVVGWSQSAWVESNASPKPKPAAVDAQALVVPQVGTRFANRYELRKEMGRGGFGVVFEAWDYQLSRAVAIKVLLRAEGKALARFAMEIRATAALAHPNLVTVFDSGIFGEHPYLVMELIEGQTLDRLAEDGLGATQAAAMISGVARALAYAHQQGLLHRDIKPQNMMVRGDGTPVLLDFGLVRILTEGDEENSRLTRTGTRLGTVAYMSPEQAFASEMDERAEVYGLGASLYHALTGIHPFEGEEQILFAIVNAEPESPSAIRPGVPPDLEAICLKCMEKLARDRYPTAAALAADLDRFLADDPTHARPLSPWARRVRQLRRNPQVLALAGAVLTLAMLLAIALAWNRAQSKTLADTLAGQDAEQAAEQEAEQEAALVARKLHETKVKDLKKRLGDIAAAPQGVDRERAVMNVVRVGREAAAPILRARLIALAEALARIQQEVTLEANDLQGTEGHLDLLDEAVAARAKTRLEEELPRNLARVLRIAGLRLRLRARVSGSSEALVSLVASRQQEEVDPGRFVAAEIAGRALVQLQPDAADFDALGGLLKSDADPLHALAIGAALAQVPGERPMRMLLAAHQRFGVDGIFRRRILPLLKDRVTTVPLEAETCSAYLHRGQLHYSLGQEEDAIADFTRALELDPTNEDVYLARSVALQTNGQLARARADLDRVIELVPHFGTGWSNRACLRIEQSDFEGALSDAREALKRNPYEPFAHFNAAQALGFLGRNEAAIRGYDVVLQLDSNNADAWIERARLHLKLRQLGPASADIKRALKLAPSDGGAWSLLGSIAYLRNAMPEAGEAYGRAIEFEPRRPGHYLNRAILRDRLGQSDPAMADANTALELAANDELHIRTRILSFRSHLHDRMGNTQAARDDASLAMALNPNDVSVLKIHADVVKRMGDLVAAEKDARALIRLAPNDGSGWSLLANILFDRGKAQEGEKTLARALALSPDDPRALFVKATRAHKAGRYAEALEILNRTIRAAPHAPAAWFLRAQAALKLGHDQSALAYLQQYLRLWPGGPSAERARAAIAKLREKKPTLSSGD
jgi:tetratricopeptide (TPR) repeat protein